MTLRSMLTIAATAWLALAGSAQAQYHDPATPPAVADKLFLTSDAKGVAVTEMRIQPKNGVLVVQADLLNMRHNERMVYYRFRWVDSAGNQVGDGESWKQLPLMGMGRQTVKGVSPSSEANDFQLEMNVDRPR